MRKVMISEYGEVRTKDGKKWEPIEIGEALFHQWGCDYHEFSKGPGNYTVAIIEFDDGTIGKIPTELIRFLDKKISEKK